MSRRASLAETLDELLRTADPVKAAQAVPVVDATPTKASPLSKLAELLEKWSTYPEASPLLFEDLHGVKMPEKKAAAATYHREPLPPNPTVRQKMAAELIDLADALEFKASELEERKTLKAAHVLRAARGLTLLREKVRGYR